MSVPVIEAIAADILSVVNTVTTANGYNQNLAGTRPTSREWRDGRAQSDGTVIVVQQGSDEDEDASAAGNVGMTAWYERFALVAYVIDSDTETTPMDTRTNQVRADLEKALTEDRTRGGRALDTIVRAPEFFDQGPGATGIVVVIDVRYRTDEDDPYTQR